MEHTLRGAAADLSVAFFSALPGVDALLRVQSELKAAEEELEGTKHGCPFRGAHTFLYPKGSCGLMDTKNGHDDKNGPACSTFWQNLGAAASGARLLLLVASLAAIPISRMILRRSNWSGFYLRAKR